MCSFRLLVMLVCAQGLLNSASRGEWTTLYGAARQDARQVSSLSGAVPLSPSQWQATVVSDASSGGRCLD